MGGGQGCGLQDRHTTVRFTDKDAARPLLACGVASSRNGDGGVAKRSASSSPRCRSTPPRCRPPRPPRESAPRAPCESPRPSTWSGLHLLSRVSTTPSIPRSLDIEGIVNGLAANSGAGARVQEGPGRPAEAYARQDRDHRNHPPIHPTGQGDPTTLDGGQLKLYNLIARRFLATLMVPATIENTKLSIDVAGEPFTATGDVLVDAGFREAYPYGLKRDEQLPALDDGDVIDVHDINLEAKQTEPPALQPGQAGPGDGEARPGHQSDAREHHRAPVRSSLSQERSHRTEPAGYRHRRRALAVRARVSPRPR